jgi:hypothetical protein
LLGRLLSSGTATAEDVVETVGSAIDGIDARWRGAVPKPLALARIIRDTGRSVPSSRPEAHARRLTVWELADRAAALAWLAHNPDPENGDGDGGASRPESPTPPSAGNQRLLF